MSSPVEQIKQRLTVEDVVGSYVKLQKAGANFRACCPFHSEKAPSFYVSPVREIWHCFGCNKGGDIFEFVKDIEGVDFPGALKILADRAGITLTYQNPKLRNEKTNLIDLMKDATYFYQKKLAENKEVLGYLWERGIKNESLKNFNIGFALAEEVGWRNLFNYLKNKGYSGDEIEKAGLAVKKDSGDFYDRFRGRIMFPLKDGSGRVVGFSGRVYGPEKDGVGKYINTPQTTLYDKSKVLYGFDRAKMELRNKDNCVLVEGQMDVIMSHQVGVVNTVAVSGTALTYDHLKAIKRFTDNIIMAFDSDEAGLKASKRSTDLALRAGFETKAVFLEPGKDPADVVKENPKTWTKTIKNAKHIIEFYLDVLTEKHRDDSRQFKLAVEKDIIPYISSIQSGVDKSYWTKEISKKIGVKEEIIWQEVEKAKSFTAELEQIPKDDLVSKNKSKNRRQLLKEKILGIVLWKNDNSLVKDFVGLDELENLEDGEKNRMILEAELSYDGIDDNAIKEEANGLLKEFKKEDVKMRLENLAEEVRKLELEGKTDELEKRMIEFQNLSKELTQI